MSSAADSPHPNRGTAHVSQAALPAVHRGAGRPLRPGHLHSVSDEKGRRDQSTTTFSLDWIVSGCRRASRSSALTASPLRYTATCAPRKSPEKAQKRYQIPAAVGYGVGPRTRSMRHGFLACSYETVPPARAFPMLASPPRGQRPSTAAGSPSLSRSRPHQSKSMNSRSRAAV
jgi:hypothetical protein